MNPKKHSILKFAITSSVISAFIIFTALAEIQTVQKVTKHHREGGGNTLSTAFVNTSDHKLTVQTHIVKNSNGSITHVVLSSISDTNRSRSRSGDFLWAKKVFQVGPSGVYINKQLSGTFTRPFDPSQLPDAQIEGSTKMGDDFGRAAEIFKLVQNAPAQYEIPKSFFKKLKSEESSKPIERMPAAPGGPK